MKVIPKQKSLLDGYLPVKITKDVFVGDNSDKFGFSKRGSGGQYEIHLNVNIPTKDAMLSVLIHELAHIYLGHNDVSCSYIMDVIQRNIPEKVRVMPDMALFMANYAMDYEVNSKYFTRENEKALCDVNYPPLSRAKAGLEFSETWEGYLEQLARNIEFIKYDANNIPIPPDFEEETERSIPSMVIFTDQNNTSPSSNPPDFIWVDDVGKEEVRGNSGESSENGSDPDQNSNRDQSQGEEDEKGPESDSEESNDRSDEGPSEKSVGSGTCRSKIQSKKVSAEEKIRDFLREIMTHERLFTIDSMRTYNRGTRGRGSIVYTSRSRKIRKSSDKLMIVIDVSGSMDLRDILRAIESVKDLAVEMNIDTRIVHWSTVLVQEYPITDIPETKYQGGGTDMWASLNYARSEGYGKVVIYSDMNTSESMRLSEYKKDLWLGLIVVDSKSNDSDYLDYLTIESDKILLL